MIDPKAPRRRLRCAVYTRKSSDEGLDQSFNSLDAQREACEAYIFSQQHEGWHLASKAYDDGGFSGGNLDRPGLKALMADVRAGMIDVIVVYKIDRLTRSLTDFCRIVEVFDAKNASFVSVTQAFNTTSSMGRLTLNMLLSFAQFEREITSERIRDKIAASKAKGMWMGGYRPLGYEIKDRGLVPHPVEAPIISELFTRLLKTRGVDALLAEATTDGLIAKLDRRSTNPMSRGAMYDLLQNPLYIGQVRHRDKRYPGLHTPIVDQDLYDQVQAALSKRRRVRASGERAKTPALLTGLIFDEEGRRYTPAHTAKGSKRYLYYCITDQKQDCDQPRLPGREVEEAVRNALVEMLSAPESIGPRLARLGAPDIHAALAVAAQWSKSIQSGSAAAKRTALRELIAKVTVSKGWGTLEIKLDKLIPEAQPTACFDLKVPLSIARRGNDLKLIVGADGKVGKTPDPVLVGLVAKACGWLEELTTGRAENRADIARREGVTPAYVGNIINLAFLAPDLKAAILEGSQPPGLTGTMLNRLCPLPLDWAEQRRAIQKACSL